MLAVFVQACIQPEPARRPKCSQLLQMPYLQDAASNMPHSALAAQVCPALTHFPCPYTLALPSHLPCPYTLARPLHTCPALTHLPCPYTLALPLHICPALTHLPCPCTAPGPCTLPCASYGASCLHSALPLHSSQAFIAALPLPTSLLSIYSCTAYLPLHKGLVRGLPLRGMGLALITVS